MSISVLTAPVEHYVKTQHRKRNQISRIIKYLRDQLPPEKRHALLADDQLIDELINTSLEGVELYDNDWHQTIYQTLQAISQRLSQDPHFIQEARSTWQIKSLILRLLFIVNQGEIPTYMRV
jgi:hypothetical protein